MLNSRDDRANFPALSAVQFRNAIDLHVYGAETAFGNPFPDQCFFFLPKSFR